MSEAFPHRWHKGRLEALSDGVFAVVMTLLVLELKLEHLAPHASNDEIWQQLAEMKRPLIAYVFSFAVTSAFWLLQHRKFHLLAHTTMRHAWLTLAFLFWVTLLPFSVSVWIRTMDRTAGLVIYFGHMTLIAATLLAGWLEAKRSGLLIPNSDAAALHITLRIASMAVGCALATAISFFRPTYAGFALVLTVLASRAIEKKFSPASSTPSAAL